MMLPMRLHAALSALTDGQQIQALYCAPVSNGILRPIPTALSDPDTRQCMAGPRQFSRSPHTANLQICLSSLLNVKYLPQTSTSPLMLNHAVYSIKIMLGIS